jgi:7,8-dihydropterin-6-yl-methyl-4-(beta-D-ribofuranosyl)aminobenzene 5'-phosphate synthase
MQITCVVDNAAQHSSQLWAEHGLAFLIETEAGRVLFDTGQSGVVLLHNLESLGIEPEMIDALAISHAHYDHTGGLPALLARTRPGLLLYANSDLFRERFSKRRGSPKPIGPPLTREALATKTALRLDAASQDILPSIRTTGEIVERLEPMGRSVRHLVREGSEWVPDPYKDDMSLVIKVPSGLLLLCGCCHAGLLNTLAHVERVFGQPIVAIVGGTHLVASRDEDLQRVVGVLAGMESLRGVYLNHCSGETALHVLWRALGSDVVHACPAGTRIDLDV